MRFVQLVWIFVGAYLRPVVMLFLVSLLPEGWLRSRDALEIPFCLVNGLGGVCVMTGGERVMSSLSEVASGEVKP
ncbi:hypothetical protein [Corallococcus sp. AS-1-12]|uniref:hypothetical protein n=1 Tax=Corallococcus sp. AS-1-12 TaxID=2874598 RepID=UPI001CBF86B1|nr:hypothetical protein [Corallococcus sp. AS-1-12]MBZ4333326.1 hypothetical protein [Corallococcus sp. AS-1-12]